MEQAFVIQDANGQALAYVYFRRDENEARQAHVLTWDEARRIATNVARLPELLTAERMRRAIDEPMPNDPERMIEWAKRNIMDEE